MKKQYDVDSTPDTGSIGAVLSAEHKKKISTAMKKVAMRKRLEKQKREKDERYRAWIRTLPCVDCGGYTHWDQEKGAGSSDASHVLTWGAGHPDKENLVPHCRKCHQNFEAKPKAFREEYLLLAKALYLGFLSGAEVEYV